MRPIRVQQLWDSGRFRISTDYRLAALIFQHDLDTFAKGSAQCLVRTSLDLDLTAGKWLLADAMDQDLMRGKQLQIIGTHFIKMGTDAP